MALVLTPVSFVHSAHDLQEGIRAVEMSSRTSEVCIPVDGNRASRAGMADFKVVTQSRTLLMEQTQQMRAHRMGDAPVCTVCGHITSRSGTCYKCLNCDSSLGCR